MKIFRPGLPVVYQDEAPPAEPAPVAVAAPPRPKMTLGMARALADARHARLTREVPGNVTQPKPEPSPEPTVTPDELKPAALAPEVSQPRVLSKPKPGKIPANMLTGGNQPRTQAGASKS